MSRWSNFFESSPEWRDIKVLLKGRLDEATKELISMTIPPEADPVQAIAEVTSLQRRIKDVYWLLHELPRNLTVEEDEEQSAVEQGGAYAEVEGEGELAGTSSFAEGSQGSIY